MSVVLPELDEATEAPSREAADAAIATIVAHVGSLPARRAVPRIAAYRAQLDAAEATALATVVGDDGNTKAAEKISSNGGKASSRSRRRAAKRAAAVKQNGSLAKKVADGDMSAEHLDVLAAAAKKTKGASVNDDDLIAKVAQANPDLGTSIIDKYLADKDGAAGEQARHDRQRRARKVFRFTTKDDCEAIMIAGDKATIDAIWNQTTSLANALYETDGGRDGRDHRSFSSDSGERSERADYPRTHDQRLFDALTGQLLNPNHLDTADHPQASPASAPTPPGDLDGTQVGEEKCGCRSAAASSQRAPRRAPAKQPQRTSTSDSPHRSHKGTSSKRTTPPKPKKVDTHPTIVVTVTLEKFLGLDTRQAAELIGSGPIADSVLAQYLGADANIIGAVFGTNNDPLWLGRAVRLATAGQFIGLIIRDKGCVLCGAHHSRCRAHHTQPWNAPQGGETNIDELVLVCDPCHRFIHDNVQTIYKDRTTSLWKLRPALPHEIPPPRPEPARGKAPMRT